MLINNTYFYGPLQLAQLTEPSNALLLEKFIAIYEPEILRSVLGYTLYNAFIAGLQEVVVLDKWTDLLYGKEYTGKNGRLTRWNGFVSYTDGLTVGTYTPEDRFYLVDGPGANDPASGQAQLRDTFLKDKTYRVVERGTGPLKAAVDYSLVNVPGGFDLLLHLFELNGVYTAEFTAPVPLPAPAVVAIANYRSLIANYVYYKYMFDQATVITGSGKKVAAAQNAISTHEQMKEVDAWNQMSYWCNDLLEFLEVNYVTYSFNRENLRDRRYGCLPEVFNYKNQLGI